MVCRDGVYFVKFVFVFLEYGIWVLVVYNLVFRMFFLNIEFFCVWV